ncbi:hypothetical protein [Nonomuraea sp. B19D2]|uniref:WD40 repeat domain-containing protein n=1 Tax=Nonomuraea sp. B19D2 TaxID=3159561 RepID=UPI0032DBB361
MVVGPSGCGKSSLARAGLVPVMQAEPGWWTLPPFLPGAHPMRALARSIAEASHTLGLNWPVELVRQRLDQTPDLAELAEELLAAVPGGNARRLLMVVDQFEEIVTLADEAERARLANAIASGGDLIRVVGTLRPEFLTQLLADPALAAVPARPFALRPMRSEALAHVIEGPARLAGIQVDEALVAQLVHDTGTGEALPLLAFTLARLSEGVERGGRLSAELYKAIGGVSGSLSMQADEAMNAACSVSRRDRQQVIAGLLRLVTVDDRGRPTRWRAALAELPEIVQAELAEFVSRRLVVTTVEGDETLIGVAHEAILTAWPPLASAIERDVTGLRARRVVEQASEEWVADNKATRRLFEQGRLAAALSDTRARYRWTARSHGHLAFPRRRVVFAERITLSDRATDFLTASVRRNRFRRARAVVILSSLLIAALIAAGLAFAGQRDATREQRRALARQLNAQAEGLRASDPRTSLRLGIAAHRVHPDAVTSSGLLKTLTDSRYAATLPGFESWITSVAYTADGRFMVTADHFGNVYLWDASGQGPPRRLGEHLDIPDGGFVAGTALNHDGTVLVVGGLPTTVWDVSDKARPRLLGNIETGGGATECVLFLPSRSLLVYAAESGLGLVDLSRPGSPKLLDREDVSATLMAMSLTPDGTKLAAGDLEGSVHVWQISGMSDLRRLATSDSKEPAAISSIAYQPDGKTLITGRYDGGITAWKQTGSALTRDLTVSLPSFADGTAGVAYLRDPKGNVMLAAASAGGSAAFWAFGEPRAAPADPPQDGAAVVSIGSAGGVTFAPDGRSFATGGNDGDGYRIVEWDVLNRALPRKMTGQLPPPPAVEGSEPDDFGQSRASVTFSRDGNVMALGSSDGRVAVFDVSDRTRVRFIRPVLQGYAPEFSPGGNLLAVAEMTGEGDDADIRKIRLWSVNRGAELRAIQEIPGRIAGFSPSGDTLAVGNTRQNGHAPITLWNVSADGRLQQLGTVTPEVTSNLSFLGFTPDGHTLVSAASGLYSLGGGETAVRLWDTRDRAKPRLVSDTIVDDSGLSGVLALSPDGRMLTVGNASGAIVLWDISDPRAPERVGQPLTGGGESVVAAFTGDGTMLAVGDGNTGVYLWDVSDPARAGQIGHSLYGLDARPAAMAFLPGADDLFAVDTRDTLTGWDFRNLHRLRADLVGSACRLASGGLDINQWRRYIVGLNYERTC